MKKVECQTIVGTTYECEMFLLDQRVVRAAALIAELRAALLRMECQMRHTPRAVRWSAGALERASPQRGYN